MCVCMPSHSPLCPQGTSDSFFYLLKVCLVSEVLILGNVLLNAASESLELASMFRTEILGITKYILMCELETQQSFSAN